MRAIFSCVQMEAASTTRLSLAKDDLFVEFLRLVLDLFDDRTALGDLSAELLDLVHECHNKNLRKFALFFPPLRV